MTSWPATIWTLSAAPGTLPVDHVFGSDHTPLAVLDTLGRPQKYGIPKGTPVRGGVWLWAACGAADSGSSPRAHVTPTSTHASKSDLTLIRASSCRRRP